MTWIDLQPIKWILKKKKNQWKEYCIEHVFDNFWKVFYLVQIFVILIYCINLEYKHKIYFKCLTFSPRRIDFSLSWQSEGVPLGKSEMKVCFIIINFFVINFHFLPILFKPLGWDQTALLYG